VLAQNIVFAILAVSMAVAALRMVTTKNVVHAALFLVIVLAGVAAMYVLLAAEFVAVVQVLVYIGAVVVLFLFGIMLTRSRLGEDTDLDNDQRWIGAAVSLFLLGVIGVTLWKAFGETRLDLSNSIAAGASGDNTTRVADSLFTQYLIPFEAASVLLLAALVGAVVVARRD
jgi:NADH-quinone oxidoreductase subunit J